MIKHTKIKALLTILMVLIVGSLFTTSASTAPLIVKHNAPGSPASHTLTGKGHKAIFLPFVVQTALRSFSAPVVTPALAIGIRYVTPGGTGDCSSWANSCPLQTALAGAVSGDEIWAAAGAYKPTSGTDRSATFRLKGGVALYGGFAGTETARTQRNPSTNLTILSGDIDNNDNQTPLITDLASVTGNTTNSYHVVTGAYYLSGATADLDGFTITAGNANGDDIYHDGGGMHNDGACPTRLTNVTFMGNTAATNGGGMFNGTASNPELTNVTFSGNAAENGGGMYNWDDSPTLTNVTVSGNSAGNGGGIYNQTSWGIPTLNNVTVSGNSATADGGGIYNGDSDPAIRNTILWGNTAGITGAQIYSDISSSPVVSDSVIQGGHAGSNIITTDPLLDALGDNGGSTQTLALLPGSSAVDAGNNTTCAATDQRGVVRPQGASCDIGAFEVVSTSPTNTPTNTATPTPTATPTNMATPTPTATLAPSGGAYLPIISRNKLNGPTPTPTITQTPGPATSTPTPTLTQTPGPATSTPTITPTSTPEGVVPRDGNWVGGTLWGLDARVTFNVTGGGTNIPHMEITLPTCYGVYTKFNFDSIPITNGAFQATWLDPEDLVTGTFTSESTAEGTYRLSLFAPSPCQGTWTGTWSASIP